MKEFMITEGKCSHIIHSNLEKQFTILERPIDCIKIPINQSVEDICFMISSNLKNKINEKKE